MSDESNALVVPREIARFLNKPLLLVTESQQDYDAFFNIVAQTIAPTNGLEWIATADYVEQKWEIKRLRRSKTAMVNATRREAFRRVFESILGDTEDPFATAAVMADQWFADPNEQPTLLEFLKTHDLDEEAISAQALAMRAPELEALDRMIQRLEICSMALLRELEFHRRASTWRVPKRLMQIDGVAEPIPLQPSDGDAHPEGASQVDSQGP